MAMAMQVALLTRWEWFKLRRRWVCRGYCWASSW